MSREVITGGFFIISVLLDRISPHVTLRIAAAVFALSFLISQGFIVYRSRVVTSWNLPFIFIKAPKQQGCEGLEKHEN